MTDKKDVADIRRVLARGRRKSRAVDHSELTAAAQKLARLKVTVAAPRKKKGRRIGNVVSLDAFRLRRTKPYVR